MYDDELSPELARLERELAMRPRPSPSAGLRRRILAATSRPLPSSVAPMSMMEFAGATAAAVLLCANLSMSLANQTDCGLTRSVDADRLEASVRDIARVMPDTPPREAFQLALPLQCDPSFTLSGATPFSVGPGSRASSGSHHPDR